MIEIVYKNASKWKGFDKLYVATDDDRIYDRCIALGMDVMMTKSSHEDCLDRASECLDIIGDDESISNIVVIQGDEPLFNVSVLDCGFSNKDDVINFYTKTRIDSEFHDPNCVKVAVGNDGNAVYFSRYSIPYGCNEVYKQLGVYVFSTVGLRKFSNIKRSKLESTEKIGLLRFLDNGMKVDMRYTDHDCVSVDTEEDRARVEGIIESKIGGIEGWID
jgi:3-deoxy-manno-octulosonate cytidylyltransferase (CMP-KDO synthetase)